MQQMTNSNLKEKRYMAMPKYIVEIEGNKMKEAVGLVTCSKCEYGSFQYGKEVICTLVWRKKEREGYCDEARLDRSNE